MKTMNKIKYTGFKRFGDVDYAQYEMFSMDADFTKIALDAMVNLYNYEPSQHTKVINFIIANTKKFSNVIPITVSELVNQCGVSKPTVIKTLKALEGMGYIKRKTGVIIVNPDMIWTGSANKRTGVLITFKKE